MTGADTTDSGPGPAEFEACTEKVYATPFVRFGMTRLVKTFGIVAGAGPGTMVIVHDVIPPPPLFTGGVHCKVTW